MKILMKKFIASTTCFTLLASLLALIPVALGADASIAATLDNTRFSRAKVTSAFKNNGSSAYADCYRSAGTCTVQRSSSYEWNLPSDGYFRLERSVNPSWPWRVQACSFGGSCEIASTIGKIYAYKPGEFFIYRAPNASYNWVFSLGFLSPYTWALGSDITWTFDGPGTGREGEYISAPSSVSASIDGEARVGSTLSATSSYVGVDGQVSYQWKRSNEIGIGTFTNISGATDQTYTLQSGDSGKYIRVTVTVSNFFGSANSTSTQLQIAAPPAQLDSTFGSVTAVLGGYSVNINNYDATYTYEASVNKGRVTIGTASGRNLPLTVTGLSSAENAQVTVTTSKSGATNGTGTVSGTSLTSAITASTGPVGRWIASSIAEESGTMLIANQGGYLYTSTDNGVNWAQRASIQNWSSVAQSADGTQMYATVAGGKIYKSTDSGVTWSDIASVQNWRSIASDFDGSVLLAAVSGGKLWRSLDFGNTWSEFESNRNWRSVAVSNNGTGMLALPYGETTYISRDSGASWIIDQSGWNAPSWVSAAISSDGNTFYAAPFSGYVARSTNAGESWSSYLVPVNTTAISLAETANHIMQCGNDGAINVAVAAGIVIGKVEPNPTPWVSCSISADANVLLATSTTGLIYISVNGGGTWTVRSIHSGNVKRRAIVATENGNEIYSAIYGGTIEYSSNGGASWSTALDVNQNWIGICASTSLNKIYAVAYQGYIYQSMDSGATWNRVEFRNLPWVGIACSTNGNTAVAVAKGGNIYNTTESGTNWTPRDEKRKWVGVALSSNGNKVAAVVEGGFVYTSSNSGDNWTQRGSSRNWSAIASSSNGNKLVATVAKGKIYVSSNSGESWSAKESNRNWLNVVSSTSGNKLIAVVGTGRIYTSSNSGSTWTARESARNWRGLYISGNGNRAFAADFGRKLYSSTDSGESWTAL